MRIESPQAVKAQTIAILINARRRAFADVDARIQRGEVDLFMMHGWDVLTHAIAYLQRNGERPVDWRLLAQMES